MKCAVYCRVSTEMDSQKDSLENQISFFENFISQKGWELVGIYPDKGISGTSTVKRTELKRLMYDAQHDKFELVLIKSLSRLARDTVDSFNIIRQLKSLNIRVITIEDNFDSFEELAELRLGIFASIAQQESETISKRSSFGITEKSRKGVFHGTPPYGYDKVNGKLIPNPVYAPTIQVIFDLYLKKGYGLQKIANVLTDMGIPTPRTVLCARNAGEKWHNSGVKLILTNPHYTGSLMQGRSKMDIKDKLFISKHGYKKRQHIERDNWIVVEDSHPALITIEEFEEAQQRLNKKAEKIFRGRGNKSLFARLAYCPDCGAGMNFKNDRKGYVCATYQKNGSRKCHSHFIKHVNLKEAVLQDIRELAGNSINMDSLLKIALKRAETKVSGGLKEMKQIEKELNALKNDKVFLLRQLSGGIMEQAEYETQFQMHALTS